MPSFRWTMLNLRCFLLPKAPWPQNEDRRSPAKQRGTGPGISSTHPWNYHIPYQPALFESMIFQTFPLGGRYVSSFPSALNLGQMTIIHQPGKPLKKKAPIPSLEGQLPRFRPPKNHPYKALLRRQKGRKLAEAQHVLGSFTTSHWGSFPGWRSH